MNKKCFALFLCITLFAFAVRAYAQKPYKQRHALIKRLEPLHDKKVPPRFGDWLSLHDEGGQLFDEYVNASPVIPTKERHTLYVQPIGEFNEAQKEIIALTAEFLHIFYNLEVTTNERIPLSVIPESAKRIHPVYKDEQVLSTYILEEILIPNLPEDAAASIAFTTSDLWPGEGWNFVFGQASVEDRVGVWSLYRNGNPLKSKEEYTLVLLRTLKTAVHEVGHMFSLLHCIKYECGMNGSNYRAESDKRPLWFCPECVAKVCWATHADCAGRYKALAHFCREHGFGREADFYDLSYNTLQNQ